MKEGDGYKIIGVDSDIYIGCDDPIRYSSYEGLRDYSLFTALRYEPTGNLYTLFLGAGGDERALRPRAGQRRGSAMRS
jgi:hypothetical protein